MTITVDVGRERYAHLKDNEVKKMTTSEILESLLEIISEYSSISRVVLFGSVARGNESRGSDIDIAISGEFDYFELDERIKNDIDTLRSIDIVEYDEIKSRRFREEIDRYGKVIYAKAG